MIKRYVLDTNVLLHDPNALYKFDEHIVALPIEVIEEIDKFKRELNELGSSARRVSRELDELRGHGSLSEGVALQNGGRLQIVFLPKDHDGVASSNGHKVDNRIVATALYLKSQKPESPVILVTKDINLRIKADALGLQAEDYRADKASPDEIRPGAPEIQIPSFQMEVFRNTGPFLLLAQEPPNRYFTLVDAGNKKKTALGKVRADGRAVIPITERWQGVWGIKPRNREQHFALDALLDENVRLVTLMGKAGTGKTLLAMAAGLELVVKTGAYRRMIVARPTVSVGREVGFLPGTLEEKLNPWMQPIKDALEFIGDINMGSGTKIPDLMRFGQVAVEALSYIRGRSIANQFMIIDEAQNLTPLEVKTIVTRVGVGTKIVFTGDPYQIDNPFVDRLSNGLTYLERRFREHGQKISAHVELIKGERSELAEIASSIL